MQSKIICEKTGSTYERHWYFVQLQQCFSLISLCGLVLKFGRFKIFMILELNSKVDSRVKPMEKPRNSYLPWSVLCWSPNQIDVNSIPLSSYHSVCFSQAHIQAFIGAKKCTELLSVFAVNPHYYTGQIQIESDKFKKSTSWINSSNSEQFL